MSDKKEYIERGAALKESFEVLCEDGGYRMMVAEEDINAIPAADVEPVVRGEWVKKPLGIYYCSVCDEFVGSRGDEEYCEYDFCPHCGAVMTDEGMKNVMERSGSGE